MKLSPEEILKVKTKNTVNIVEDSPLYKAVISAMKYYAEQEVEAGQQETIVIALEKRRKQFEDTYEKESSSGNFMNADKAGFYEECYRNVIKDLKEEVQ